MNLATTRLKKLNQAILDSGVALKSFTRAAVAGSVIETRLAVNLHAVTNFNEATKTVTIDYYVKPSSEWTFDDSEVSELPANFIHYGGLTISEISDQIIHCLTRAKASNPLKDPWEA